ncbi:MAG: type IX secretion system plug protein domain-containing protein, partial [Bacteroidota bacterium]
MVRMMLAAVMMCTTTSAQDFVVRGLSVYGLDNEQNVPIIVRDSIGRALSGSHYITIQFDVQGKEPPSLKIRFLHCNRDWIPEDNLFIQDETHNTSFVLDYRTSPNGVEYYSYRYKNRFPDDEKIVRFNHSGNWIFRLMDKEEKQVLGEGRFFVVDNASRMAVTVTNGYLTDAAAPLNQIHKVQVGVRLPNEIEGIFYTTVDVYQNRRFHHSFRIDVNDRDPYTKVEGITFGYRLFTLLNVPAGNEYRSLNLSSTTRYPNRATVRLVEGVDQPRNYWRTGLDKNVTSSLDGFTG